jgi:L-asparaginase II
MRQAPWAVSGTGRLDLELSELATEPIMTKVGAAGLICGAIVHRGLGFALKIHSGVDAARPAAVRALLERWCPGLLPEGSLERSLKVRNVVGNTVGRWEVEWR